MIPITDTIAIGEDEIAERFILASGPGGQNGLDLALKAKDLRPGLKVLMTSGYTEKTEDAGRYGDLLATMLQKPYRGTQLVQQARSVLKEA